MLTASVPLKFSPVVLVREARELEEPGLVPPSVSAVSDLQSPLDRWCFESLPCLRRCLARRFGVEVLDWESLVMEAGQLCKTLLRVFYTALGGPA